MSSFVYFAYGSNMLPARLQARCPSARVIGTAMARGFKLSFGKRGKDFSGKATLIQSPRDGPHGVPGVLYEIDLGDRAALDHAEGDGYERFDDFMVFDAITERNSVASTYIAKQVEQTLVPFDWYLALVLAGARYHGLNEAHLRTLVRTVCTVDTNEQRDGRMAALLALERHGYPDHRRLLGGADTIS